MGSHSGNNRCNQATKEKCQESIQSNSKNISVKVKVDDSHQKNKVRQISHHQYPIEVGQNCDYGNRKINDDVKRLRLVQRTIVKHQLQSQNCK